MPLTYKAKFLYNQKPDHCPYCNRTDLIFGDTTRGITVLQLHVTCNDCLKEWTENYNLTGITEIAPDETFNTA